jgi:large subunit ribosomal protein L31
LFVVWFSGLFTGTFYQLIDKVAACKLEYMMKTEIHPAYHELKATCSCGNVIAVGSTREQALYLDVCSACHPFYTGKQKVADTGGRIDRFNKRFGSAKK